MAGKHPYNDVRLSTITTFMTKMTNRKIERHPFRHDVTIGLCDVNKDVYGDADSTLTERVLKSVIIQKNTDIDYVNAMTGVLMNDGDLLPWLMILTTTGLPRTLHQGDYVEDEGVTYKVSAVKPVNRQNPDIIECFIHPDRDDFEIKEIVPESFNELF